MNENGLSEHGFPLVMACDHVLHQEMKPVDCTYSPPDYICEKCFDKMKKAERENVGADEAIKFVHLYCSDCVKRMMLK